MRRGEIPSRETTCTLRFQTLQSKRSGFHPGAFGRLGALCFYAESTDALCPQKKASSIVIRHEARARAWSMSAESTVGFHVLEGPDRP
jgi:hypothetical protein